MAKNETQVAVKGNTAVALATDFEQDASGGFGEMTQDDFALPFLRLLTSTSPEVGEREGRRVRRAAPPAPRPALRR